MLATNLHYDEVDYKELLSIIASIFDSISIFNKNNLENNKINLDKKIIQMKSNEFY